MQSICILEIYIYLVVLTITYCTLNMFNEIYTTNNIFQICYKDINFI